MTRRNSFMLCLLLAAFGLFVPRVYAAAGTLDTTYGTDGVTVTSVGDGNGDGDQAQRTAVDSSGRAVVVGWTAGAGGNDFAVVRYTKDGVLDSSFGTGGKVTVDFNTSDDSALAVVIDPLGNIVVGGVTLGSSQDFAIARLTASGVLDSTFGTEGKTILDFSETDDTLNELVIQPDGKIIAVGDSVLPGTGNYQVFALARYNTNGSLDSTFDTDGKVTTDFNVNPDNGGASARSVAIGASSKIVAGGGADGNFALARYDTNGSLDSTFDTDGKVTTSFGNQSGSASLGIDASGKIVTAGFVAVGATNDFALARYNTNGSLDSTFDTDGKVTTDISGGVSDDSATNLLLSGNLIYVGGITTGITGADFAVTVYNNNGSLNTSYGSGKFTHDFGGDDVAVDLKVQPADNQIILLGIRFYNTPANENDIVVARVNGPTAEGVKATVSAGGTVTTDTEADSATSLDPFETSVTTPSGGTVAIAESQTGSTPISGYGVFNQQAQISAPVQTASSPLKIVFTMDDSIIPNGVTRNNIQFYRNNVLVPSCTGADGVASPNPCISLRENSGGGDIRITILTSAASSWGANAPATGALGGKGKFNLAGAAFAGTQPTGSAEFKLSAAYQTDGSLTGQFTLGLPKGNSFKSTSVNWLWTDGTTGVMAGTGRLGGEDGYSFQVMVDDSDAVRIIISKAEKLIFDNLFGNPIEFGVGNLEPIKGNITVE